MLVNLLTNPHKEQREWLYHIAIQLGKLEYNDNELVTNLFNNFDSLVAALKQHAKAEESFIEPLYALKAPSLFDPFDEDHEKFEIFLASLCQHKAAIQNEKNSEKPT